MNDFWDPITAQDVGRATIDKRYVDLIGHYAAEVHLELRYDIINRTYLLMFDHELVGDTRSVEDAVVGYNALLKRAERNSR